MFKSTHFKRILFFLIFDIFISLGTLFLAYNLRFNFYIDEVYLKNFFLVFGLLLIFKLFSIGYFRIYNRAWTFMSLFELKKLFYAHLMAYTLFVLSYYLLPEPFTPFPRSVLIIDFVLSFLLLGTLRISKRILKERSRSSSKPRTLLIGISSLAHTVIKDRNEVNVTAVIDDDDMMIGTYMANMKVESFKNMAKVIEENQIEAVIFSKELERERLNTLYNEVRLLGIEEIKLLSLTQKQLELKAIAIEDLLAREPKDLDRITIANFIVGKKVLITGAGGSIGSELSRQVALFGASQILLLDHSEFNLYQITEELKGYNIVSIMASVQDRARLEEVFVHYRPELVLHAAAYKHVPLCEENVEVAIENNIFGTKNVIDLSVSFNVEKFLLISTDKAVRPTNVMGATKRVCELYAGAIPSKNTEIVAVRFGNVLGSSGSVIPKFKSQIEKGENITVTHPEITRYFMLIPEACQLVLQAASIAKGGELFILDMGKPVKIVDLAKRMIDLSCRKDIEIVFTGLRQGEKLYEELLINDGTLKTEYNSILVVKDEVVAYKSLLEQLETLRLDNALESLKKIVPEFKHLRG